MSLAIIGLAYAAVLFLTLGWFAVGARSDHSNPPSGSPAGHLAPGSDATVAGGDL